MVFPTPSPSPAPPQRRYETTNDFEPESQGDHQPYTHHRGGYGDSAHRPTTSEPYVALERPPGIGNLKPSPPFSRVVGMFEVLRDSKPATRKDRLDHWFNIWRENVGNDLYPAMRLILPHKDRERATYGLKESGIAKAYIAALGLDRHSRDATRLLKWKQPTKDNASVGNFPNILYEVVAARSTVTEGKMSVDDVNDLLDEISRAPKEADKAKLFTRITEKCTPEEQRWITRIILKDLGIAVKETTVLAVFHPDAMDMFNTSSDLKRVCWLLPNQNKRADDSDKRVQLFHAFQPMLCKRGKTLKECVKMMGRQEFIMEEKLDGERMQLHKRGNQFFYCSRKGKDYTYLYGANIGEGALTPYIQEAFDQRVADVILDGEMVVWDPNLEKYCNFGYLKTAALDTIRTGGEDAPRPCYKIFDILYMKSSSGKETLMTEMPLKNRQKTIKSLFYEIPGRFEFAISRPGKTVQDVEKLLNEVVESRGEGLVIKTPNSKYILGGRENCWMKVKPEYMDNMGESVDVLVISGNYGKGGRGGKVSTFICGVIDDSSKASKDETRIGTGLTFAEYEWINSKPWKPLDRKRPPPWMRISTTTGTEDVGDVYLEPHESFIVSVKAAAITPTDQYACQMTMRFPRCTRIRDDLKLDEVFTYTELVAMSLGKRKADDSAQPTKKRRVATGRQGAQLMDHSRGQTMDGPQKSDLFDGLTFRIFPDNLAKPPNDKASLEKLVYEEGGDFTQAVTARTGDVIFIYGGTTITPAINKIIKNDEYDIFKPQWILDCVEAAALLHPTEKYYFHATTASRARDDFADDDDEPASGDEREEEEEDTKTKPEPSSSTSASRKRASSPADTETESEDEGLDPEVAKWTKITKGQEPGDETKRRLREIPDEAQDSDAQDSADDRKPALGDVTESEESDAELDGWKKSEMDVNPIEDESTADKDWVELDDEQMGESSHDMEYDESKLFRHLCFYLDTPENAQKAGMAVKASPAVQATIASEYAPTLHTLPLLLRLVDVL
ncbi:DNA ligase (ATP) [Tulasnella sp. 424]|nr:DNA ligase (ATP) [Tulasnella sp. 424]